MERHEHRPESERGLHDAEPAARLVVELPGEIPGAVDRARHGREQAVAGETVPLDAL